MGVDKNYAYSEGRFSVWVVIMVKLRWLYVNLYKSIRMVLSALFRIFFYAEIDPVEVVLVDDWWYVVISKVACSSIKKSMLKEKDKNIKIEDDYSIHLLDRDIVKWKNKIAKLEYTYTFVRNPFDRLVSAYKSKILKDKEMWRNDFNDYLFGIISQDISWEDFVNLVIKMPDRLSDRHFKSQYATTYRRWKCIIDSIWKMESLEKDFEPIRRKFGFSKLPHFNKTKQKGEKYADRYTLELLEKVYKRYQKDVHVFWYYDEYCKVKKYLSRKHKAIKGK